MPEEGDLSEGGGGGTLPVPHHLPSSGAALPDPELPPRVEHRIMVTGGLETFAWKWFFFLCFSLVIRYVS